MRRWLGGAKPAEVAALAYLAGVAGFVVWVCAATLRDHYTVPYWDDWRILDDFFSTPLLEWLWAGGNGHRLPATFGLLKLDYELFGGHMHLLTVASLVCLLACIPVLWVAARSCREIPFAAAASGFGFTVFAIFLAARCFNLHWAMNQGSSLTTLLFLISLVYAVRFASAPDRPPGLWWKAIAAAALATFGHGIGFASWASLAAIALVARLPVWSGLSLLVAGGLTVFAYQPDLASPISVGPSSGSAWLQRLLESSAIFVGTPPGRIAQGFGWADKAMVREIRPWIGGAALLGAALYGARRLQRGGARASQLLAVGLMVFPLVGALVIGLVRPPDHLGAWRFACWSALFWVGCAWALLGWRREVASARLPVPIGLAALSLAASFALVPAYEIHDRIGAALSRLELALLMEAELDAFRANATYTTPAPLLERVARRLRRDRRSVFSDPRSGVVGSALRDHFGPAEAGRCRGSFEPVGRVPGSALWSFDGSAWDAVVDAPVRSLLIVDSSGTLRGLGNGQSPRLASREAAREGGWFGYANRRCSGCTAYGLLPDGSLCVVSRRTDPSR